MQSNIPCPNCSGTGTMTSDRHEWTGRFELRCPRCLGTGKVEVKERPEPKPGMNAASLYWSEQ